MSISKRVREEVYDKYAGHCAYCGCEITMKQMQVDHIIPQYLVGSYMVQGNKYLDLRPTPIEQKAAMSVFENTNEDHIDNLLPACRQCNFYKQTFSIDEFRNRLAETIWHKLEKDFNYRLLTKYGKIVENRTPVKFYFEIVDENKA